MNSVDKLSDKTAGRITPKMEKFAQEYVLTGNQSEAHRRAYPKSQKWDAAAVANGAWKLMQNPDILARIKEMQEELKQKFDISAERLLLEQSRIALFDFRKLFDDQGRLLICSDMPPDVAASVSTVKISRIQSGDKNDEEIIEIKLWNKNKALDSLFKNKGLYAVDNSHMRPFQNMSNDELIAKALELVAKLKQ